MCGNNSCSSVDVCILALLSSHIFYAKLRLVCRIFISLNFCSGHMKAKLSPCLHPFEFNWWQSVDSQAEQRHACNANTDQLFLCDFTTGVWMNWTFAWSDTREIIPFSPFVQCISVCALSNTHAYTAISEIFPFDTIWRQPDQVNRVATH